MHDESGVRRSSRIKEEIPITLIGSDTEGKVFLEHTHTTLVSLFGAGVVSQYKLSAEQEMLVRLQDCDKEAEVRVIGQMDLTGFEAHTLGCHPLAFVAFVVIGCPLIGAGVLLYLWSLVPAKK